MLPVWIVLVWVVLPLWVIAGFLDYLCHRSSHIERATGARESLIHWLMLAEVGLPLTLAVFFRINALLLCLMILCLIAHEVTGYLDLKLAMATRRVTIFEHQVHSALEILPLTAILLVMTLHWPQTQALFGLGPEGADFTLGAKQAPRWGEIAPPLAAFLALAILPYAEELLRGWSVPLALRPIRPSQNAAGADQNDCVRRQLPRAECIVESRMDDKKEKTLQPSSSSEGPNAETARQEGTQGRLGKAPSDQADDHQIDTCDPKMTAVKY